MSEMTMRVNLGGKPAPTTVTEIDGTLVIFGSLPFSYLEPGGLPREPFGSTAIATNPATRFCGDTARLIPGAIAVFGPPDKTKALRTRLAAEAKAKMLAEGWLSDEVLHWCTYGPMGASAAALFYANTGVFPAGYGAAEGAVPNVQETILTDNGDALAHPVGVSSLARCILLVERVPGISLDPVARSALDVNGIWCDIRAEWDDLVESLNSECPDWRDALDNLSFTLDDKAAPETDAMLAEIIGHRTGHTIQFKVTGKTIWERLSGALKLNRIKKALEGADKDKE